SKLSVIESPAAAAATVKDVAATEAATGIENSSAAKSLGRVSKLRLLTRIVCVLVTASTFVGFDCWLFSNSMLTARFGHGMVSFNSYFQYVAYRDNPSRTTLQYIFVAK
ncbi:hypothetical protein PFISCL1PPCAC_20864, partial [Pristionchus fissidentatus]